MSLVRQARELGADLIKADPTDEIASYHKVIEAAVVPVLVRGGSKVDDKELLVRRTHAVLEQGAAGVVYGRNIIQHEKPAGITCAIMAILHEGTSVDEPTDLRPLEVAQLKLPAGWGLLGVALWAGRSPLLSPGGQLWSTTQCVPW